jgi:hypothetical protein
LIFNIGYCLITKGNCSSSNNRIAMELLDRAGN